MIPTTKPEIAYVRYDFALLGSAPFFTKNRIKPTRGMRKLRMFRPILGLSSVV